VQQLLTQQQLQQLLDRAAAEKQQFAQAAAASNAPAAAKKAATAAGIPAAPETPEVAASTSAAAAAAGHGIAGGIKRPAQAQVRDANMTYDILQAASRVTHHVVVVPLFLGVMTKNSHIRQAWGSSAYLPIIALAKKKNQCV
jgi:hypothetical protein